MHSDSLATILALVFLVTPFIWLYFLIRKQQFQKLIKKDWSRKKISGAFFGILFASMVGIGVFAEPAQPNEINNDQEVATAQDANNSEENQVSSEFEVEEASPEVTYETAQVVRVIDGDTIEIEGGQRVRYIGIDTPESKHPNKPVECFSAEASKRNAELVADKEIQMEQDVNETDRYGRLLRYVYVDGQMVNETLVADGFAQATAYPPDVKYQERFSELEIQAREQAKGLWGDVCYVAPTPTPTLIPTPTPVSQPVATPVSASPVQTTTATGACKYACSGPDKDCKDFATHAEAQAFFNCCGFTVTNDPMQLDGRGVDDGIACEGLL